MPAAGTESSAGSSRGLRIALAGNPNCGKSALFNAFTGIRQKTGNWPGVTVERKEGSFSIGKRHVVAIDLPGIYSLDTNSLDEQITRDYLLSHDADLIVNLEEANKEAPKSDDELADLINKAFLTESGKKEARKVFGL